MRALFRFLAVVVVGLMLGSAVGCTCGDDDDDSSDAVADDDEPFDDGEDNATSDVLRFGDGHVTVWVNRLTGRFDIAFDGTIYFAGATSALETGTGNVLTQDTVIHSVSKESEGTRHIATRETGDGFEIRITHPTFDLGTATTVLTIFNGGGLLASMEFESVGIPDLMGLIPVYVGDPGSGFAMKSPPAELQILQNGTEKSYDHYVELAPGDTPYQRGIIPLYLKNTPSSSSNWNALVYDRASGESLLAGYLTFDRVIPEVVIGYDPQNVPVASGHPGYFTFQSRCAYLIPREVRPKRHVKSELFWLEKFSGRPQDALETYAATIADRLGIVVNKAPTAGWDSWYTYGDKINQKKIRDNLAGLVELFGDYGMTNLQIDLGWEKIWGDWTGEDRFPDGMDAIAAEIAAAGLEPEIWVSAYNAMRRSSVLTDHPDWEAPFVPFFNILMIPGAKPLDLSRPEVVDYQRDLGAYFADLGFTAMKFDFAYYQTFVTALRDPSKTVIESYRDALRAFREGFGEDRFFINILLMGTNYGLVDSMRIGVDTWGCWGDDGFEGCPDSFTTTGYDGMGLRIALKTLARRYYYNNVIWVNHPDQIFFRDHLSLEAQRSWGTAVALSGAVISLGERVAKLSPEEIDTYRRFLPNLGITGVPRDLFEHEYPEVWLTPLDGLDPGGAVLGLYSWGNNWDLTQNPRVEIPEGTRHHEIALADLGLAGDYRAFEFWTQTDLGYVDDGLVEVDVPARDSRVVVLRPVKDRPYLVASNRHVSQGGTDLHDPFWTGSALTWTQSLVQGFDHTVYVDPVGEPGTPSVSVTAGAASVRAFGDLWAIDVTPAETGDATVTLTF
ncbi:MAG: alpha-galactosidase [Deltaproteobacteria bacterium]|nr:alpha-galactosidase [Deltaproteobacteria bacterium]